MIIKMKYLEGTKWLTLELQELMGNSIISFMKNSNRKVVAAVFENDKPVMFISNDEQQVNEYKVKGISVHIDELKELLGDVVMPKLIVNAFPDGRFEAKQILGKIGANP